MRSTPRLLLCFLASLCWPLHADNHRFTAPQPKLAASAESSEITLYFWYGCDACRQLSQALQQAEPRLSIRRIPIQLANHWYWGAKAFYCAEQLAQSDALHRALYSADWSQLTSHAALLDWFVAQGAPRQQVETLLTSPLLNQQLDRDKAEYQHQIKGVPAVLLNSGESIDASQFDSAQQMLVKIQTLLQTSRTNPDKKAP